MKSATSAYRRLDPGLGEFALRPLDPDADAELLHAWVTHPKAAFWLMRDATAAEVREEYRRIDRHPHHTAYLGTFEGRPAFLVERYDPSEVELAGLYPAEPGDVGMHFLCAPAEDAPVHGFTRAVLTTVLAFLFEDPAVHRVVVEPDVRNAAVQRLNAAVGFEAERVIRKPEKDALLSFCTREQFRTATATPGVPPMTHNPVSHLRPGTWASANRRLVAKALSEFSHERLLTPRELPDGGGYAVRSDDGSVEYRFRARRLHLDHWLIDPRTLTRHHNGHRLPLDAVDFVLELRGSLGLADEITPVYLEEITATLAGAAYKLTKPELSASELARAGFQAIESGMTEGHPCFVANNGRIGFGGDEYHRYAPEAAHPLRLVWLAAHRDHSTFSSCSDLDYETLIREELSPAERERFAAALTGQGLDPADYHLLPVHPWQWFHKLSVTFAGELAERRLVLLGEGDDLYLAQQSIRTFFNTSAPHRHYVKTALSVLNMGFMRGLSAAYMEATPAINDWLAELVAGDEILRGSGLTILRERAAIGYRHRQLEAGTDRWSPYRKMLAALWRESPVPSLAAGERLATMASLLHTDRAGRSFAAALIEQSGLPATRWLRRYLDAYLTPLLHSFYAHDLAFMPHGENTILVLDETGTVSRAIFKDIAEEIAVLDPDADLPAAVRRIRADVPDHLKVLSILTDVFDCFFRHLAAILDDSGALPQDDFWRTVAECVTDYRDRVPHLAAKLDRYDLFAPSFALSCLNRLQLRDNQQMLDLADPAGALQLAGTLANPLAPFTSGSDRGTSGGPCR